MLIILLILALAALVSWLFCLWLGSPDPSEELKWFFESRRRYLRYVLTHKWYVFLACLWLKVPIHQAILHDWSKFLPSEWGPYVRRFNPQPDAAAWLLEKQSQEFDIAWRHHQRRQPHHWQYWLLTKDSGETLAILMPDRFVREMVADWMGAGKALGKPDTKAWYLANKDKMNLHPSTRERVEVLLNVSS